MADTKINNIDPSRLTLENYSISDVSLINETVTSVAFSSSTDYIEYFVFLLLYIATINKPSYLNS